MEHKGQLEMQATEETQELLAHPAIPVVKEALDIPEITASQVHVEPTAQKEFRATMVKQAQWELQGQLD